MNTCSCHPLLDSRMADFQFRDALSYFTDKICVPRVSSCVLFFAVIGERDRVPRTWPNSFSFESFQQRCEKAYVSKDTNTLQCEPTWKTDARQLANTFSSLWLDGSWPQPAFITVCCVAGTQVG